MRFNHKVLLSVSLIFLLSACVTQPVVVSQLNTGALAGTDKMGVIWFSGCYVTECDESNATKGVFIPQGVGSVGAMAIVNGVNKDEILAIGATDTTAIVRENYLATMNDYLQSLNIEPVIKPDPYLPTMLFRPNRPKAVSMTALIKGNRGAEASGGFMKVALQSKYDLSAVAKELGVRYVLVLDVTSFGAGRDYGPLVIPISTTYGLASVRLHLLDTETNAVMLDDFSYYEIKPESDEDDQSYTEQVIAVARQALESAVTDVTSTVTQAISSVR